MDLFEQTYYKSSQNIYNHRNQRNTTNILDMRRKKKVSIK